MSDANITIEQNNVTIFLYQMHIATSAIFSHL